MRDASLYVFLYVHRDVRLHCDASVEGGHVPVAETSDGLRMDSSLSLSEQSPAECKVSLPSKKFLAEPESRRVPGLSRARSLEFSGSCKQEKALGLNLATVLRSRNYSCCDALADVTERCKLQSFHLSQQLDEDAMVASLQTLIKRICELALPLFRLACIRFAETNWCSLPRRFDAIFLAAAPSRSCFSINASLAFRLLLANLIFDGALIFMRGFVN